MVSQFTPWLRWSSCWAFGCSAKLRGTQVQYFIFFLPDLAAALILVFSGPFAREFAAEREKRPAYKKYLLNAFTVMIVMAAGAATLIDIVALFSSK
jgi:hypothetical protein